MKIYDKNWPLWNAGIDAVKTLNGMENSKNLVFYSMDDPMCRAESMKDLLHIWKLVFSKK